MILFHNQVGSKTLNHFYRIVSERFIFLFQNLKDPNRRSVFYSFDRCQSEHNIFGMSQKGGTLMSMPEFPRDLHTKIFTNSWKIRRLSNWV